MCESPEANVLKPTSPTLQYCILLISFPSSSHHVFFKRIYYSYFRAILQVGKARRLRRCLPQLADHRQAISGKAAGFPETEVLYVPSDFREGDRNKYGLISLGENEQRLLQGIAFDYVSKIRVSKPIDSGKADKKLQEYGQHGHTRTGDEIRSIERLRQCWIDDYSAIRKSMIALGMSPDDPSYPLLTLKETFRKATYSKRALGDSQRFDGPA